MIDVSRNITAEIISSVGGFDKHFLHTQTELSTTWVITHGLKKYPSVEIVDTAHDTVFGSVRFNSINQLTITFTQATNGKAFLN